MIEALTIVVYFVGALLVMILASFIPVERWLSRAFPRRADVSVRHLSSSQLEAIVQDAIDSFEFVPGEVIDELKRRANLPTK